MKKSWILFILIILAVSGCAVLPTNPYVSTGTGGNEFLKGMEAENAGKHSEAVSYLKKATELAPQDTENIGDYFRWLCVAYYGNGQHQEAIDAGKKALNLPHHKDLEYDTWKYIGLAYDALGQMDSAISSLKRSIELAPDKEDTFSCLSLIYANNKQYDEAITAAKRAIELKSDNSVAYISLGVAYYKKKQYEEAIKALKKAIEIDPKEADAYFWMGSVFMDKGAYNEAAETYKKAIEAAPSSNLYDNLAIAYYRMGRYDDAIAAANKAIERHTIMDKSAAGSFGLRSLINRAKGNQEGSFRDAEKAYSLDSTGGWARLSLGAAYLDQGKNDEAIKLLQVTGSQARILEATAYAKLEKMKEAANIYLSIPEEEISPKNIPLMHDRMALLQIFKPFTKAHTDKARSFESKGQYKEALSELSEALKTADETETETIQEAIFSMTRRNPSLSELPEEARKYVLRAEVLQKEGNFEQAATEFKKAIQIAPYVAELYYSSALINAELKKYPEAIRYMKTYLKAAPDAPNAGDIKDEIIKWEFTLEREKH